MKITFYMLAIISFASACLADDGAHENLVVIEANQIKKVDLKSFRVSDTQTSFSIMLDRAAVDLDTKKIATISMGTENKNTVYVIDPNNEKIVATKALPGSDIVDDVEYFDGHKVVYSSNPYPFTGVFNIYEFDLDSGKRTLLAETRSGHFSYREGCFIYKANNKEFYFVKGEVRSSISVSGEKPTLTQDCQNIYYISPWLLGTDIEEYSFESKRTNVVYRTYFGSIKKVRVSKFGQYLGVRKSSEFRVEQIELINSKSGELIYETKNMVPRNWFFE